MQMLIDIDEETVNTIEKIKFIVGGRTDRKLQLDIIKAIKNGTPLPKGHGDLIDRSKLKVREYLGLDDYDFEYISKEEIVNAKPIIKAERNVKDEKSN